MIGVANLTCSIAELKRAVLFFDRIVFCDASESHEPDDIFSWQSRFDEESAEDRQFVAEISYLLTTSYFGGRDIFDYPGVLKPSSGDPVFDGIMQEWEHMGTEIKRALDRNDVPNWFEDKEIRFPDDVLKQVKEIMHPKIDISLRMEIAFQELQGNAAIQVVEIPTVAVQGRESATQTNVLQLALNKVPVPHDTVPWEQIFDMKQDTDLADRARKLRLWITDITKPGLTLGLAEERLADGISDYEAHLKYHKIKYSSSAMRSVVVGTAGLLEDLAKFRLEKLAGRFLSIRERRAEMMLSELKAPGRALSLITALKSQLKR